MYQQVLKPVGDSYALTSIFAVLPILTLFVLLGVLRVRAWVAALSSLGVAILVAIIVYSMSVGQTLLSATEGGAFGFFPILWIVINAIWIYNVTVETGHFDVLRRSFEGVSPDMRVQAIIVAFCFGALLEALAGFGTPVAISSVMLIGTRVPTSQSRDRLADCQYRPGRVRCSRDSYRHVGRHHLRGEQRPSADS